MASEAAVKNLANAIKASIVKDDKSVRDLYKIIKQKLADDIKQNGGSDDLILALDHTLEERTKVKRLMNQGVDAYFM